MQLWYPARLAHIKPLKIASILAFASFTYFDAMDASHEGLQNYHEGLFAGLLVLYWALDSFYGSRWRHASEKFTRWVEANDPYVRYRLALQCLSELNDMYLWDDQGFEYVRDNVIAYLGFHLTKSPLYGSFLDLKEKGFKNMDRRRLAIAKLANGLDQVREILERDEWPLKTA